MKKTFLTAFALLSFMNFASQAKDEPLADTTAVRHLNLNEVEINASRTNAKVKDLPQKIDVITQRMIKASPASDVAGLLKRSASLDISQYPGVEARVSMRGFSATPSGKYTVILVNGRPAGTENIASIDLNNVERIEILKGPFSAQYGSDAMGGVVNIVTKNSTGKLGGSASIGYGSFQTSKANINVGGAISNLIDFDLAYAYHNQNKDYKTGNNNLYDKSYAKSILDASTYGVRMENTQFEKHNLNARLGVNLAENWKVDIESGYYKANDIETPGSFWHIYGMDTKDIERYNIGVNVLGKIGAHSIRISPFVSKENTNTFDLGNDGYGDLKKTYKNYGFQLNDVFQIGEHKFVFGIDNKTDNYKSKNYDTSNVLEKPFTPDYKNRKTGIYGEIHFKLFEGRFNATLGGRGDLIKFKLEADRLLANDASSEKYNIFTKNIGLKYSICDYLFVHSTWGDAFLAPNAFQVAGFYTGTYGTTRGNPNLKAEKSNTFDFGFNYKNFKKGVDFDISYFRTHHKNKIISEKVNPDGIPYNGDEYTTYSNALSADMDGLEVVASYDFGAINDYDYSLRVYFNYTHLIDAKVKHKVAGVKTEGSMRYVRDNTASFGLEFDNLKGFSSRLNGRYIGHRYEDNYMFTYLPPTYMKANIVHKGSEVRPELFNETLLRHPISYVFDYSAAYTFKEKYTVGLTVSNLLDENYTEKDGYNMPGRVFMAKFSYKF